MLACPPRRSSMPRCCSKDGAWKQIRKRAPSYSPSPRREGNPVAQNRLARLYANGVVFPLDLVEAAKWHLIARRAGVSDFSLDIVLTKLTPEQRAAAERFVDAYEGATVSEVQPPTEPAPAPALDSGQNASVKANSESQTASPQPATPSGATGKTQSKTQSTTQPKGTR